MDFEKIYCSCEGVAKKLDDGSVTYSKVYLGTIGPVAMVEFTPCRSCKLVTRVVKREFCVGEQFKSFPDSDRAVKTFIK